MAEYDDILAEVQAQLAALQVDGLAIPKGISDQIWLILTGTLVFFMNLGFAMLEGGSVQRLSVVNIMFKNVGTVTVGAIAYWLFGYAFAFGTCASNVNSFIGTTAFAFKADYGCGTSAFFFFEFTFAATGATIVSGAVAERITLGAYFIVATIMTGFVFALVSHWVWSSVGFMSAFAEDGDLVKGSIGLIDFAGSGVVHVTGGAAAFVGALIIGPRMGRFVDGKSVQLGPSSFTLQTIGTMILWFGWYGFNCGSTLIFDGTNTSKAAITTTLAPSAAAVTAVFYSKIVRGTYDLPMMLNSILAGLVAITAGCTAVADWASIVIGSIGFFAYIAGSNLLEILQIDDPVGASPVHLFGGVWGLIAVGIFSDADAILDSYGAELNKGPQFGMQIVGTIIIVAWSGTLGGLMFLALKATGMLRVSVDHEKMGIDVSEHGGAQILHF